MQYAQNPVVSVKMQKKADLKPVAHDYRKNYEWSAKSMESDMVVSMVKYLKEKGIKQAQ